MLVHHRLAPESPGRVVLLGGRGFIGSVLRAVLDTAGIEHVAPDSRALDLAAPGGGDRLRTLLRDGDAIVVLAALTPDRGRGVDPFLANLRMAAAVGEALQGVAPGHVVYFSSDAVYPFTSGLVSEDSCAAPGDLYGMMHLAREVVIRTSTRVPVAVLRPTLVYGAGDTHNSYGPNRFRRMARKDGAITLFGGGEETRDHVLVDDVADLTLLVLQHRTEGTLNVATGRSVSFLECARMVARQFEGAIDVKTTPRQSAVTHRHFDVSALRRAFPAFAFTSLDAGLARTHREMLERE